MYVRYEATVTKYSTASVPCCTAVVYVCLHLVSASPAALVSASCVEGTSVKCARKGANETEVHSGGRCVCAR